MPELPTDFYSTSPRPWPAARLPDGPLSRLSPRPLTLRSTRAETPATLVSATATLHATVPVDLSTTLGPWLRATLERRLGMAVDVAASRGPATPTTPSIELRLAGPEDTVPEHPEGYSIRIGGVEEGGALVVAREPKGLWHAAVALARLVDRGEHGLAVAPVCELEDAPSIDRRILGGWALARSDRLREAIDLAVDHRANRVLYNWWGWVPGELPSAEDAHLVEYARARGVELICELRRMSLGRAWRLDEPQGREGLLEVFDRAVDAGFRSFGLLFDDVAWESAEDECRLLLEVRERLHRRLGDDAELLSCPRYYWSPGQMSLDWLGHADAAETAEQRRYLETWGRLLPADIDLYIASFWGDFPPEWRRSFEEGYADLLRRQPIFFDNQLINDYRLGALLPFALHQRPRDLASSVRGFLINAPRPLDAYAASVGTSLDYAWSPERYDPETALGAAIEWRHGNRAGKVAEALERLRVLAVEMADGRYTATHHYRTIADAIDAGRRGREDVRRWAREARAVRSSWLAALALDEPRRLPWESTRALTRLVEGTERLQSDLELFEAALDPTVPPDAWSHAARGARRRALASVAEILPSLPGLALHVESADGESVDAETPPTASAMWSWAEYFYRNTARELVTLIARLTAARSR